MATVVCRGLRSWPCPGSPRRTHDTTPLGMGSFSFLEAVSAKDDDDGRGPVQRDGVYIHPLVVGPKPSLRLSQKSLELCTENLGNETGSDVSDNESTEPGVFSSMPSMEEERLSKTLHGRPRKGENHASASFPPPLTTIKETRDLQYKTHREQGRLVLEAVRTSSANTVFRAERSQGRLTLSFASEPAHIYHHYEEGHQKHRNPESVEETEGDKEDNVEAVEGCMFKRPSGCKDRDHRLQHENRGMSNWETFWVAT
ncbi:hypothetical protein MLD38_012020 [Melastoma candidum]|uniref:Uncharacterized protein n=1 Tax=Melastoma candidum TaxID=119954 RepID=A0ACB9R506_9MYRT|nr:hypothetical protein MLD38_012020 [Melastoma candidum]